MMWSAWGRAVVNPVIDRAVGELYDHLDKQVATRGPVCWASGRCCQFETFEHRLYVTGLEVAWVLKQVVDLSDMPIRMHNGKRSENILPSLHSGVRPDASGSCPFQAGKLCSVHTIRPMGCRVFFCQHGTEQWQHELYEQYLGRLRAMHEAHGLTYCYMEWRSALSEAIEAFGYATLTMNQTSTS